MKPQHQAGFDFAFFIRNFFFREGLTNQRPEKPIHARAWLDDVWHVAGIALRIEMLHGFAAEFLVLRQVEIAARRNPFALLRAERKLEEKIHRRLGMMRALLLF